MTKKVNRKSSARRKLIPAVGMLTVSAMMLSSATYAWFTMSREVEISNIQMSATVPEDIQISLGAIAKGDRSAISDGEATASLANGKGVLWAGAANTAADDGAVLAPVNDWDWSNLADISEYYQFGKLIPATSTNGDDIFFTPYANGVGKTLAKSAGFFQAADNLTAQAQSTAGQTDATAKDETFNATLHAVTAKNGAYVNDTWSQGGDTGYKGSNGWDNTKDDGYYVDIPVWLRTSSSDGADLSVQAYAKPRNDKQQGGKTADEALYRAVRVAIIDVGDPGDGGTYQTSGTTKNLIPIADAWTLSNDGTTAGELKSTSDPFALANMDASILDWYGRNYTEGTSADNKVNVTNGILSTATVAVASITPNQTTGVNTATYGPAVVYNAIDTNDKTKRVVAHLNGPKVQNGNKGSVYGVAHKIIVRVWLEGEDPDCWNETAGQDWSINLKFNNETTAPLDSYGGADLSGVNQGVAPKQNGG